MHQGFIVNTIFLNFPNFVAYKLKFSQGHPVLLITLLYIKLIIYYKSSQKMNFDMTELQFSKIFQ